MDPDHNALGCPKGMQNGKTALFYPNNWRKLSLRSNPLGNSGTSSSRIIGFFPLSLGFEGVVAFTSVVVVVIGVGVGAGAGVSTRSVGSSSK